MDELEEKADRLRALWKSGRDKYSSFYTVLNEVKAEIGDENLPDWCFDNLRIGFTAIIERRRVLVDTDAMIVKEQLEAAKREEALAKRAEREERANKALDKRRRKEEERKRSDDEKRRRQLEKQVLEIAAAEHKNKVALLMDNIDKVKVRRKTRIRQAEAESTNGEPANARAKKRHACAGIDTMEFAGLIKVYKKGEAQCLRGHHNWVEGSLVKAAALYRMRDKHPNNRIFGDVLEESGISLDPNIRAALIGLYGAGENVMREKLRSTESKDYRKIWSEFTILRAV